MSLVNSYLEYSLFNKNCKTGENTNTQYILVQKTQAQNRNFFFTPPSLNFNELMNSNLDGYSL